jgi:predicted GTPase
VPDAGEGCVVSAANQLSLLEIERLVLEKRLMVACAERDNLLHGGEWRADWRQACDEVDSAILRQVQAIARDGGVS